MTKTKANPLQLSPSTKVVRPFQDTGGFTAVPNAMLDHIMPECSPNAWKVLCLIARKTIGWYDPDSSTGRKEDDWIAYSQIMKGTGIGSKTTISNAIDALLGGKYILRSEHRNSFKYALNVHYLKIDRENENGNRGTTGPEIGPEPGQKLDSDSPDNGTVVGHTKNKLLNKEQQQIAVVLSSNTHGNRPEVGQSLAAKRLPPRKGHCLLISLATLEINNDKGGEDDNGDLMKIRTPARLALVSASDPEEASVDNRRVEAICRSHLSADHLSWLAFRYYKQENRGVEILAHLANTVQAGYGYRKNEFDKWWSHYHAAVLLPPSVRRELAQGLKSFGIDVVEEWQTEKDLDCYWKKRENEPGFWANRPSAKVTYYDQEAG